MKDLFNNDLIVGKEYVFYNDINGTTYIGYGKYLYETTTGLATIEITKRIICNKNKREDDTFHNKSNKVSVKPFKLIPNEQSK